MLAGSKLKAESSKENKLHGGWEAGRLGCWEAK
jgi:hypothetical protein